MDKVVYYNKMEKSLDPLKIAYEKIKVSYKYKKPIMTEVNGQLVLKDQTEMVLDCSDKDIEQVVVELQKFRNQYFIVN